MHVVRNFFGWTQRQETSNTDPAPQAPGPQKADSPVDLANFDSTGYMSAGITNAPAYHPEQTETSISAFKAPASPEKTDNTALGFDSTGYMTVPIMNDQAVRLKSVETQIKAKYPALGAIDIRNILAQSVEINSSKALKLAKELNMKKII